MTKSGSWQVHHDATIPILAYINHNYFSFKVMLTNVVLKVCCQGIVPDGTGVQCKNSLEEHVTKIYFGRVLFKSLDFKIPISKCLSTSDMNYNRHSQMVLTLWRYAMSFWNIILYLFWQWLLNLTFSKTLLN